MVPSPPQRSVISLTISAHMISEILMTTSSGRAENDRTIAVVDCGCCSDNSQFVFRQNEIPDQRKIDR